jgi:outer membrane protein
MRRFFFSIIAIFSVYSSSAQQHTISLEQGTQAALAYSNAIKNGELNVKSAQAGIIAAKSDYLPSVSGTGIGLYGFRDFVSTIPGIIDKGINNLYLLSASGSETVYAGGKVSTENQIAALQLEVSKVLARQSADSVVLLTEQKYWNIVNLQAQQKTLLANQALLNSLLQTQNNMLASGLIAKNDLLKVKVQLSQLQVTKSKTENRRKLALFDFSIYTGIPYDSLMTMQDIITNTNAGGAIMLQPDTTLSAIPSYQLLNSQIENALLQTKLAKAGYLPSLSLSINAAQTGSFNKAFSSSFVPSTYATLSIPISEGIWGRSRQKVRQRKISENIAQNNLRDSKNQLKVGIMRYWYDMKDELTQISYAKDNLNQATENLKVNQDNYKAGLSTVSDVLDAQSAYQQAEETLNTAYADFQIKKAAYNYAIGKIRSGS